MLFKNTIHRPYPQNPYLSFLRWVKTIGKKRMRYFGLPRGMKLVRLAVLAAAVASVALGVVSDREAEEISSRQTKNLAAENLEIRDENGVIRMSFGLVHSGGKATPSMKMYSESGQLLVELGVENGGSKMRLCDAQGNAALLKSEENETTIAFADAEGDHRVSLVRSNDLVTLVLADEKSLPRVSLSNKREDAGLVIGDPNGLARTGIMVDQNGARFVLKDTEEQVRFVLGLEQEEPFILRSETQ